MTEHSPITPPPDLVRQWEEDWHHSKVKHVELEPYIAAQAAQWGADQELEACCDWMSECTVGCPNELRAIRRPKPPSLKEQALAALNEADQGLNESEWRQRSNAIRRALEALPDD